MFIEKVIAELQVVVIFGIFFAVLEFLRPAYKLKLLRKETGHDAFYGLINIIAVMPLVALIVAGIKEYGVHNYVPYQIFADSIEQLPFLVQILIAVFIMDFSVYIRHRFMHEILWDVHATHHSAEEITWLTKYRLHPIEAIIAYSVSALFMHILGFSGDAIAAAILAYFLWDLSNHTNIDVELPKPFCYLIATPNYHKWHHALAKDAINKNYVVAYPFIDLIFGTYYNPGGLPEKVGMFYEKEDKEKGGYPHNIIRQLLFPFRKIGRK